MFCVNCNIETTNPKFCSRSCSASFTQKGKPSKNRQSEPKNCLFCHKVFVRKGSKYCNMVCSREAMQIKSISRIESGQTKSPFTIKQYLYKVRGRHCEICLIKEWCGQPVPLILDHINGHSEDNSLENLRVVCPNCDAQLPTYKSKNKGKGRHRRRQRYAEGKSY